VTALLHAAAARLAAAGIEDPLREARILLGASPEKFDAAIARREKHEPVAYILGRREFWSLDFEVSPAVLIPRPDSETLVETALKHFKDTPPRTILDLGTGSGCLLIALLSEWKHAAGTGLDISQSALAVAQRNAERLGVAARAQFQHGDFEVFTGRRFDLVISNPPYIPTSVIAGLDPDVRDYEPHLALNGGVDGLEPLRRIATILHALLAPGAPAIIEIGHDQGRSASQALQNHGLKVLQIIKDLAGNDRVIMATLPQ
jgi:release factor glutamine methyltransferase